MFNLLTNDKKVKNNIIQIFAGEKNKEEFIGNGVVLKANGLFISAYHVLNNKFESKYGYLPEHKRKVNLFNIEKKVSNKSNDNFLEDFVLGYIDDPSNMEEIVISDLEVKKFEKFTVVGYHDVKEVIEPIEIIFNVSLFHTNLSFQRGHNLAGENTIWIENNAEFKLVPSSSGSPVFNNNKELVGVVSKRTITASGKEYIQLISIYYYLDFLQ